MLCERIVVMLQKVVTMQTTKTYYELTKLKTIEERYQYLRLVGTVGESTFGFDRYINQALYSSYLWIKARQTVIVRDLGCDLGLTGYEIYGKIIVHHINPIKVEDITDRSEDILRPEFLICCSHNTHMAIHYSDEKLLPKKPIVRRPGDTTPWHI